MRHRSNYAEIPPRLEHEDFSTSPTTCATAAIQNKYPETPSGIYTHPKQASYPPKIQGHQCRIVCRRPEQIAWDHPSSSPISTRKAPKYTIAVVFRVEQIFLCANPDRPSTMSEKGGLSLAATYAIQAPAKHSESFVWRSSVEPTTHSLLCSTLSKCGRFGMKTLLAKGLTLCGWRTIT